MPAQRKLDSLGQQAQVALAKLGGKPDLVVDTHPQYLQGKAAVDEAQRRYDHAVVRAPFGSVVTEVDNLQPGLYLVAATAALTNQGAVGLVSNDKVWIDASLEETDLAHTEGGRRGGRHRRCLSGPHLEGQGGKHRPRRRLGGCRSFPPRMPAAAG